MNLKFKNLTLFSLSDIYKQTNSFGVPKRKSVLENDPFSEDRSLVHQRFSCEVNQAQQGHVWAKLQFHSDHFCATQ